MITNSTQDIIVKTISSGIGLLVVFIVGMTILSEVRDSLNMETTKQIYDDNYMIPKDSLPLETQNIYSDNTLLNIGNNNNFEVEEFDYDSLIIDIGDDIMFNLDLESNASLNLNLEDI